MTMSAPSTSVMGVESTVNTASMTPREIDTILADLWGKTQVQESYLASDYKHLSYLNKRANVLPSERERTEDRIEKHKALIAILRAEASPYEIEFIKRPWNRYFLVTNQNGHVHRGMDCTTCYPTTEYAWLPELSDCVEGDMVEEFGEKACTICFPDAPAYKSFGGPGRRDAAAKAERDAEKAAKAAEKAAKAITAPDGSPLEVPTGSYMRRNRDGSEAGLHYTTETYRTKVAARNGLSGAVKNYAWYGPTHPSRFQDQVKVLIEALRLTDIPVDTVIERAMKKARSEGAPYDIRDVVA